MQNAHELLEMPIKVHVKGKRRAPLPPTKSADSDATQTALNELPANNDPVPARENDSKSKKKLAPTPPVGELHATYSPLFEDTTSPSNLNMIPNNLSACNSPGKLLRKKHEGNVFFNIIGTSKSSDKGEPVLKNYRPHLDLLNEFGDVTNKNDNEQPAQDENTFEKVVHRNFLVWNCQFCTLENPFWKIVCAACDNMKPYDLPTTSTQTDALNLEIKRCFNDEKNKCKDNKETNDKKIDNLAMGSADERHSNAYDDIYATNGSENVIVPSQPYLQPYAAEVVYRKKVNNNDADNAIKRNSEIMIKDYPTNTLEMEKQRLRAVIRSMNNRALAEKYPVSGKNNAVDNKAERGKTPDYEAIDEMLAGASKSGAIRKTDTTNYLQKLPENRVDVKRCDAGAIAGTSESGLNVLKAPGSFESTPSTSDNREKSTKVSTSVQTDIFIKTVPATYATLQDKKDTKPQSDQTKSTAETTSSASAKINVPLNVRDLPDACYEYIGNLSMYGDQDVFTNTLKKLENALSDKKNETAFVEMNVSNLKLSMNVPKAVPKTVPTEKSIL